MCDPERFRDVADGSSGSVQATSASEPHDRDMNNLITRRRAVRVAAAALFTLSIVSALPSAALGGPFAPVVRRRPDDPDWFDGSVEVRASPSTVLDALRGLDRWLRASVPRRALAREWREVGAAEYSDTVSPFTHRKRYVYSVPAVSPTASCLLSATPGTENAIL